MKLVAVIIWVGCLQLGCIKGIIGLVSRLFPPPFGFKKTLPFYKVQAEDSLRIK
jgi:hypothetical protein